MKRKRNMLGVSALAQLPQVSQFGAKVQKFVLRKKKNPGDEAEAAAQMYDAFHGEPSGKVTYIEEQVEVHEHLAQLGKLRKMKVRAIDGEIVTLKNFGGALLCANGDGTQLYIRGGDQSLDLEPFAIDGPIHDLEDLGEIEEIRYFTTKTHLGSQGGKATYYHQLNEEDEERDVNIIRRPRLIQSTRDNLMNIVGGAYTIEPEGIAN